MNNIIQFLNYLADHYTTVLMYLAAAGVLPAIVIVSETIIKKLVGLFTDAQNKLTDLEKQFLVYTWGVIISLAHYLLYLKTNNPWIVLVQGAVLFVMSQPFYIKGWKPLKKWLLQRIKNSQTIKADAKAAILPPEGIASTPAPEVPFQ